METKITLEAIGELRRGTSIQEKTIRVYRRRDWSYIISDSVGYRHQVAYTVAKTLEVVEAYKAIAEKRTAIEEGIQL